MRRVILVVFADLVLVALSGFAALFVRDNLELSPARVAAAKEYFALTLASGAVILPLLGIHRSIWRMSVLTDYSRIAVAACLVVLTGVAVTFQVNRMDGVARSLPILQILVMTTLMVGARVFIRQYHSMRQRRKLESRLTRDEVLDRQVVLIAGVSRVADLYLQAVAEYGTDRIVVAGILGQNDRQTGRVVHQHRVFDRIENVAAVLQDLEVRGLFVSRIVVSIPFARLTAQAREALLNLERSSAVTLDFFADRVAGREIVQASGASDRIPKAEPAPGAVEDDGFAFSETELEVVLRRPYWRLKRLMDVVMASLLLVAMAPIAVAVALLVAIDVGRPVMFWQQRPGLGGRPFRLYKLRTMAAAHDASGRRIPDDRRMSRIGHLLRKTRLDELPQLAHIVVGDMSFVGPRPLLPVDQPRAYSARLLVRPGLTGWAQVVGGRTISARDKAALDIWYVRNASLRLDLEILVRTVPMVLLGERVDTTTIERAWSELQAAGICSGTR